MFESVESGSLHRLPLKVRTRAALLLPVQQKAQRRAVMAAARAQGTEQRRAVRAALAGIETLLCSPILPPCRNRAEQLEQRYGNYRQQRRETAAVMAAEPDGSRPALAVRATGAVNGTETRHSPRWQSSGRAYLAEQWQDWACYSLVATADGRLVQGEQIAGKAAGKAGRQKAGKAAPQAQRRERLLAAAGTVRMAEQD
jgi:hypothetical protein